MTGAQKYWGLAFVLSVLTAHANAAACTICYGAIEGSMTSGLRWAVATLLLIVFLVLFAFGWFFLNLSKKDRREGV